MLSAIERLPESYNLLFGLAKLYENVSVDKAIQAYRNVIERDNFGPHGIKARNNLASLFFIQKKYDEAEVYLEEVLKENSADNIALLLKGKLALIRKDALTAINALRPVLKNQPDSLEVSMLLKTAHLLNKEPELAKEVLQRVVEANPGNLESRLRLAQFLASTKDLESALKELNSALKLYPKSIEVLKAKVEVNTAMQDPNALKETLEYTKINLPDNVFGYVKMGQLYLFQKKYDKATAEFEKQ